MKRAKKIIGSDLNMLGLVCSDLIQRGLWSLDQSRTTSVQSIITVFVYICQNDMLNEANKSKG